MIKIRDRYLRDTETINEKYYSLKHFFQSSIHSHLKPNTVIFYGNNEFIRNLINKEKINNFNLTIEDNIIKFEESYEENLTAPYLIYMNAENQIIKVLNQLKHLMLKANILILNIPLYCINEKENYLFNVVEYLNSNNFSLYDIFGGFSSHYWQPDDMFCRIYFVFLNNDNKV